MDEDETYRALRTRGAELWCDERGWRVVIPGSPMLRVDPAAGLALVRRDDIEIVSDAPRSVQAWKVRR